MANPTQPWRRRLRVFGATSLVAGVIVIAAAVMGTNPALASDGSNSSPSVALTQEVQPDGFTNGLNGATGTCTEDACKRVPLLHVKKVTCCEDGVGNVIVWVHNPNAFKLKVGVTIDSGQPEVMWVNGGDMVQFKFLHVANGNHVIRASVWLYGNVWCNFAKLKFCVKCTSPTPSHSPSKSPSASPSPSAGHSKSPCPSPSVSASHSARPTPSASRSTGVLPPVNHTGNNLPVTGTRTGLIAGLGVMLLGVGALALVLGRRRVFAAE